MLFSCRVDPHFPVLFSDVHIRDHFFETKSHPVRQCEDLPCPPFEFERCLSEGVLGVWSNS